MTRWMIWAGIAVLLWGIFVFTASLLAEGFPPFLGASEVVGMVGGGLFILAGVGLLVAGRAE